MHKQECQYLSETWLFLIFFSCTPFDFGEYL